MKRFAISLLSGFAIGALSIATGLAGPSGGGGSSMAGSSMNGASRSGLSPAPVGRSLISNDPVNGGIFKGDLNTDSRKTVGKRPVGCLSAPSCVPNDLLPCVPPQLLAVPVENVIECPDLSPLPKDVNSQYDLYVPARAHLPELIPIPPG